MASISSRIFIEPISAVKAEPERPATMMAVSRMPTSRSARMATMLTAKGSAPNGFNWTTPCCITTAPIRKQIRAMIGTALKPAWSR